MVLFWEQSIANNLASQLQSQKEILGKNFSRVAQESTTNFAGIVSDVAMNRKDYLSRQIDRIIIDMNSMFSVTALALSKSLAKEVVVQLEPIVEKHNQINQALINVLTALGQVQNRVPA